MDLRRSPVPHTQPRVRGRTALEPALILSNFKIRAVIDTVVCKIERPSIPPVTLKGLIDANVLDNHKFGDPGSYVNLCPDAGTQGGNVYSVTLQTPSTKELRRLSSFEGNLGLAETERLDVAIDFKPYYGTPQEKVEQRRQIRDVLVRHLFVDGEHLEGKGTVRCKSERELQFFRPDFTFHTPPHLTDAPLDGTFYFGAKGADIAFKIYDKCHDRRRGDDAEAIPPSRHRIRCELTLRGAALRVFGLLSAGTVATFDFRRLKRLFDFRIPTILEGHPEGGLLDQVARARAKIAEQEFRRGGYACHMPLDRTISARRRLGQSIAYRVLNDRVGMALSRANIMFALPESARPPM